MIPCVPSRSRRPKLEGQINSGMIANSNNGLGLSFLRSSINIPPGPKVSPKWPSYEKEKNIPESPKKRTDQPKRAPPSCIYCATDLAGGLSVALHMHCAAGPRDIRHSQTFSPRLEAKQVAPVPACGSTAHLPLLAACKMVTECRRRAATLHIIIIYACLGPWTFDSLCGKSWFS